MACITSSSNPQAKLVRVTQARFWMWWLIYGKFAMFGKIIWSVELSEHNKRQLWIPEGFAHGFVVLSESADFLYKATDYYHPAI